MTIRAAKIRRRSGPPFSPKRRALSKSATAPRQSRNRSPALTSGDVLLIAGKGHETGQIIGDRVVPFSDHEAVTSALKGKVA